MDILSAYVIGKIRENIKELTFLKTIFTLLLGLFFIYFFGVVYLYISYNLYLGKNVSFYFAFFYGFVVCIAGDLVLTVFSAYISMKLLPVLRKNRYIE